MSSPSRLNLGAMEKRAMHSLGGFKAFILRGNVVDLAIGIVIGAAFTSVVNALVSDIITPLIPTPKGALSNATFTMPITNGVIKYGEFINAVISFLIVAAVLYFLIVRPFSMLMDRYKPQKVETQTRECPYCFQSVHPEATRCPYCTSQLALQTTDEIEPALMPQEPL